MIELGFLITAFDLASSVLPELATDPDKKPWMLGAAAFLQFGAWVGRFVLQPKLSGGSDADQ